MKLLRIETQNIMKYIFVLLFFGKVFGQEITLIQKKWINEDDGIWKIEFKSDQKCYWIFPGETTKIYYYSISKGNIQCGFEVPIGVNFSYLNLINVNDPNEKTCYEITTLNDQYLAFTPIGFAGYKSYLFKKDDAFTKPIVAPDPSNPTGDPDFK